MSLLKWVEGHGFEVVVSYYVMNSVVSSMPELPTTAGFWARWGYMLMHVLFGNLKKAAEMAGVKFGKE